MIRETSLAVNDLILPLFAISGSNVKNPVESMPDHYQLSIDNLVKTAEQAYQLGIPAVMLFGIPDRKDELASSAYADDGIVQNATIAVEILERLDDRAALAPVEPHEAHVDVVHRTQHVLGHGLYDVGLAHVLARGIVVPVEVIRVVHRDDAMRRLRAPVDLAV